MSLEVQQLIKYMRDNVDIPMISSYAKRPVRSVWGRGFVRSAETPTSARVFIKM